MLKSLEEDKAFWVNKEAASSTYVAAINEEPVIPEYDYSEVASMITAIDEKIAIIKHALNVTNATAKVQVGNSEMSIDTILIKMAQLNKRKGVLDQMRKQFYKIIDISVKIYPASPVANLNAAAAAIERGNTQAAGRYLQMASHETLAYKNCRGAYELLCNNTYEGIRLLKAAKAEGSEEATYNLKIFFESNQTNIQ